MSDSPAAVVILIATVFVPTARDPPVIVTTSPTTTTPVSGVTVKSTNAAPLTLYSRLVIVVLTAIPVTVDVTGVVAPTPPAGATSTCEVEVRSIVAGDVPVGPVGPDGPVTPVTPVGPVTPVTPVGPVAPM